MRASILSLASFRMRRDGAPVPQRSWSQQELAELYRVRDRLVQSGLRVALDVGLTDEGEPWAVFLQGDSGEVFVHIARLNGAIVVANTMANVVYRGEDFRSITDQMLRDAPLVVPPGKANDAKVVMHPRSVFTAFVAAAVVLSEFVRSIEPAKAGTDEGKSSHDKAVAETKTLFPQIFDRVLARDSGWTAPIVSQGAAASLMAAAVGAVLMMDDHKDESPLVASLVSEASAAEAGASAPSADNAGVRSEGASDDLAEERQTETATSQTEPKFASAVPQSRAEDEHTAAIEAPILTDAKPSADQTARTSHAPAEPAAPSFTAKIAIGDAHEPAASEPQPSLAQAAAASGQDLKGGKEFALILDSILTIRLPEGSNDRLITQAIDRAIEGGTLSTERPSGPRAPDMEEDDNKDAGAMPDSWVLHARGAGAGAATMRDGSHDVVLLTGQDMTIYNFRFNEDYLLVDGVLDSTSWIKSIEVHGDDVLIQSTNGSVISLIDTHGLVA